jgi:hypothetical protein
VYVVNWSTGASVAYPLIVFNSSSPPVTSTTDCMHKLCARSTNYMTVLRDGYVYDNQLLLDNHHDFIYQVFQPIDMVSVRASLVMCVYS